MTTRDGTLRTLPRGYAPRSVTGMQSPVYFEKPKHCRVKSNRRYDTERRGDATGPHRFCTPGRVGSQQHHAISRVFPTPGMFDSMVYSLDESCY